MVRDRRSGWLLSCFSADGAHSEFLLRTGRDLKKTVYSAFLKWSSQKRFVFRVDTGAVVAIAKPGDLLLAHDYELRRKIFASIIRGKRWNWCEITDADLPESRFLVIESPVRCGNLATYDLSQKR